MKTLFVALQVATGISSLAGFGILLAFVALQTLGTFMKESAATIGAVIQMFLSLFTSSQQTKDPTGIDITQAQVALGILFLSLLASVFLPGYNLFLHILAALVMLALAYCIWTIWQQGCFDAVYIPFLGFWLFYYGASTLWAERFGR